VTQHFLEEELMLLRYFALAIVALRPKQHPVVAPQIADLNRLHVVVSLAAG